jgi:8-oxo-dGTP pyrophosphatase MutT (NUDIX family)
VALPQPTDDAWVTKLREGYARQARKRVAADIVLTRPDGRVLIVNPDYKPGWDLPGGMVEEAESPTGGLTRELAEELGLGELSPTLAVVEWRPPGIGGADLLMFCFWADLSDDQAETVAVQDPELTDARWVSVEEARELLAPMVGNLLSATLDARRTSRTLYLETIRQD